MWNISPGIVIPEVKENCHSTFLIGLSITAASVFLHNPFYFGSLIVARIVS